MKNSPILHKFLRLVIDVLVVHLSLAPFLIRFLFPMRFTFCRINIVFIFFIPALQRILCRLSQKFCRTLKLVVDQIALDKVYLLALVAFLLSLLSQESRETLTIHAAFIYPVVLKSCCSLGFDLPDSSATELVCLFFLPISVDSQQLSKFT